VFITIVNVTAARVKVSTGVSVFDLVLVYRIAVYLEK